MGTVPRLLPDVAQLFRGGLPSRAADRSPGPWRAIPRGSVIEGFMSTRTQLPVLPLRQAVLFPHSTRPVSVGRASTGRAVRAALASEDKRVFVVLQTENDERVTPDRLHTIGTIATVQELQHSSRGVHLLLQGERRGIAIRFEERDRYIEATLHEVDEMLPIDDQDTAFLAMQREVRESAITLAEKSGFPDEWAQQFAQAEDAGELADLVAGALDIENDELQKLLEVFSVEERLRRVLLHVQRQISVIDAQKEIQSRVEEQLGDRQKEMLLREQMKAIQQELGDSDSAEELEELKVKLDALELPEATRKEVDRDFDRLTRMPRDSMEHQLTRSYLETVTELPWSERSEERLELAPAAEILDEDHYGLADVKDRVLEYLAVLALGKKRSGESSATPDAETPAATDDSTTSDETTTENATTNDATPPAESASPIRKGPILLFAGPPGVGKTSIAKGIARAMGREYVRVSLGGARDEADIRGHRRTYVGALPGRIIEGMRQAGTKNPVFLLDEIDKLGVSHQGDPAAALLEVLDPAQNHTFVDHYLGIPFDLSEVLFIATANFVNQIPAPLLDRMEVVEFSGYTEAEKLEIAKRYLLPRQREGSALDDGEIDVTDDALARVISHYTRESGLRQLEKELGKLTRKVARRIATDDAANVVVDSDHLGEILGRPRVHPERIAEHDQVGVATGMYYTPVGGDIMFVEATTMRGKGEMILTGQLGDVMRESARAAWSYARAHAPQLLIDETQFERDLHLHVPAGAIPKDGPSAGVAMTTAIVSALSGVAARRNVAMTGEVTLTGRVLPIGGVKEKVLGAVRAGIEEIILPAANEADLDDLPKEIRDSLQIHLVERIDEVLERALVGGIFRADQVLAP